MTARGKRFPILTVSFTEYGVGRGRRRGLGPITIGLIMSPGANTRRSRGLHIRPLNTRLGSLANGQFRIRAEEQPSRLFNAFA